jgi:DNA adenine methylase
MARRHCQRGVRHVVVEAERSGAASHERQFGSRRDDFQQYPRDGLSRIDDTRGVHTHASPAVTVRPLLKWAGGKRQLLNTLGAYYPPAFSRYIEPFFGSGAVFFDLVARGVLHGHQVRLADVNPDLVGCYVALRDRTDEVIAALGRLEREHRVGGNACYYEVRDRRFNPVRSPLALWDPREWQGSVDEVSRVYTPDLAAMLIFLNRTGFNGLFRLNRHGEFNVPAGRYTDPRICDPDHLRAVASAMGGRGVTITWAPFDTTLADAGAGVFV